MNAVTPAEAEKAGQPSLPSATKLQRASKELVGQVFYGTLLRQLRSSAFKGKYGHGGRAEELFQAQLDEVFAKEAGITTRSPISDAIVDRLKDRVRLLESIRRAAVSPEELTLRDVHG